MVRKRRCFIRSQWSCLPSLAHIPIVPLHQTITIFLQFPKCILSIYTYIPIEVQWACVLYRQLYTSSVGLCVSIIFMCTYTCLYIFTQWCQDMSCQSIPSLAEGLFWVRSTQETEATRETFTLSVLCPQNHELKILPWEIPFKCQDKKKHAWVGKSRLPSKLTWLERLCHSLPHMPLFIRLHISHLESQCSARWALISCDGVHIM